MASVDVSGLVSGVADFVAPVGLVGLGMLLLHGMQKAFEWLRAVVLGGSDVGGSIPAYSGGDSGLISSSEEFHALYGPTDDPAFNALYNSGQAVEGVDFVSGVSYRSATSEEQASWDQILEARERSEADAEMTLNSQSAAMQDMAPGAQGSLFVTSGEGYGITVGTQGGSSYYDENDDFDMDPSALSDSQRRTM